MDIDLFFTASAAERIDTLEGTVVVVDVLRATTTIVQALANGASDVYPTSDTEDAIKLATGLGRDETLLCGERRGLKIEGYDLGNSPAEFDAETVGGRRLVMNTTNGTRAFLAADGADRVVALSFLNLSAVARSVAFDDRVTVVCAGIDGRFALDDAVCAGKLLESVERHREASGAGGPVLWSDAARAACTLARSVSVDASFLGGTASGAALIRAGLEDDLARCAVIDRYDVVPEMSERAIRIRR